MYYFLGLDIYVLVNNVGMSYSMPAKVRQSLTYYTCPTQWPQELELKNLANIEGEQPSQAHLDIFLKIKDHKTKTPTKKAKIQEFSQTNQNIDTSFRIYLIEKISLQVYRAHFTTILIKIDYTYVPKNCPQTLECPQNLLNIIQKPFNIPAKPLPFGCRKNVQTTSPQHGNPF